MMRWLSACIRWRALQLVFQLERHGFNWDWASSVLDAFKCCTIDAVDTPMKNKIQNLLSWCKYVMWYWSSSRLADDASHFAVKMKWPSDTRISNSLMSHYLHSIHGMFVECFHFCNLLGISPETRTKGGNIVIAIGTLMLVVQSKDISKPVGKYRNTLQESCLKRIN